ncbi:histidinol dehydrogenase [Ectobacillus antri]|jgi:histidinol dehydrogenase|uniref:Histidinol dehydrogenase n=1 Tax=Ectobacillus antri TaxID=2486280 RepID=A0ABT6H5V3_9BACI|nr:histidinol dehydrogenase [Ectobacillus antri]MDG4656880.1 histidinol dehydrogenase [Ectobacillus antri]MDG5754223.1 histidinol dehydrogenase [Ectobacillus antri]
MKVLYGKQDEIIAGMETLREEAKQFEKEATHVVERIVTDVKARGDEALRFYTETFDKVTLESFRIPAVQLEEALASVEVSFIEALEGAKRNIVSYHEKQKRYGFLEAEQDGIIRGQLIRPLDTVGVYVPGGTAAYPSSVLMNVLPAKIAGVKRIVMVTPPHPSGVNPYILAAAKIAGVDEIYSIGGAQAVAALAYGTESIPRVDKIVGPGNLYVALAKRAVFGDVNIDMIAGPSDILVIADETGDARYIAADLLSQAEHDVNSAAILVTTDQTLAEAVQREVKIQLQQLPRKEIAQASVARNGAIIVVDSLEEAFETANRIAPEHLELHVKEPMMALSQVKHAGSIFLGPYAPEPLGDYYAGPNHVLPTSGTARFFSALSVDDFIKKSSILSYTREALYKVRDHITILAEKEGLHAHAKSINIRFEEEK